MSEKLVALKKFISESTDDLEKVLSLLNWTLEGITNVPEFSMCSFNSNHFIPKQNLTAHSEKCQWNPENCWMKAYCDNSNHDVISNNKLIFGLPKYALERYPIAGDEANFLFTPEQRLALYEHAVSICIKPQLDQYINVESALPVEKKATKPPEKSYLELLAEQRDQKRRRISYRNKKSVYTNRKTVTEVLRELISNHMERLFGAEPCKSSHSSVTNQGMENAHRKTEPTVKSADHEYHHRRGHTHAVHASSRKTHRNHKNHVSKWNVSYSRDHSKSREKSHHSTQHSCYQRKDTRWKQTFSKSHKTQ